MNNLILIEGLPGSGKSSTAHWLHHSFRQSRIPSQWFYELSEFHPLALRSNESKISRSQLPTKNIEVWKRFIQSEINECEVVIIDSGFFQKNIMHMMNSNIEIETIQEYARQVEDLVSECNTHFVYLDAGYAEKHLQRVFRVRGKRFQNALTEWSNNTEYSISKGYVGIEGCLKYWRDYKGLCDRIYERSKLRKIKVGVTNEPWSDHHQTLSRYLKVSNYNQSNYSPILSGKLTGDYLLRGSDIIVSVAERSGCFTIKNLLHALEAESLMIPEGSNRFFIRGHDVSLQFEEFRQGIAEVIKVSSSWNKLNGYVFDRVWSGPVTLTSHCDVIGREK